MGNAFDDYKDRVHYDFILTAKMPYTLEGGQYDQQLEALQEFEDQIEKLIADDDYNKMYFDNVEVGRVYPKLLRVDDTLDIKFGVVDEKGTLTEEDIIADAKEYMYVLDSNIENNVSVVGFDTGDEVIEPAIVTLKGSKPDKVEIVDLIVDKKEDKVESIDLNTIDKKLVTEEKLIFQLNENKKELVLNDNGNIDKVVEGKIVSSYPFSKKVTIGLVQEILTEGYKLQESEVTTSDGDTIDTDKTKEQLQQANQEIEEIAQMKKELQDKVDQIVEERKEFPSSEYTSKKLSLEQLNQKSLKECLNPEQQEYIITYVGDLDQFLNDFETLYTEIPVEQDEELISIDEYINYLLGGEI